MYKLILNHKLILNRFITDRRRFGVLKQFEFLTETVALSKTINTNINRIQLGLNW